jgi:hypothetical protein
LSEEVLRTGVGAATRCGVQPEQPALIAVRQVAMVMVVVVTVPVCEVFHCDLQQHRHNNFTYVHAFFIEIIVRSNGK